MIKTIIDIFELYVIVRLIFGGVKLVRGKNNGIMGKVLLLIKRGINRRLDEAVKRQSALMGYKVVPFKKYRRMAK